MIDEKSGEERPRYVWEGFNIPGGWYGSLVISLCFWSYYTLKLNRRTFVLLIVLKIRLEIKHFLIIVNIF